VGSIARQLQSAVLKQEGKAAKGRLPHRLWHVTAVLPDGSCCPGPVVQVSNSGPFVAGELDPAEIEICRDAEGKKVVLGEGAFGRVSGCS
jgi:hypothetical protein